jgi:hypothetical protein
MRAREAACSVAQAVVSSPPSDTAVIEQPEKLPRSRSSKPFAAPNPPLPLRRCDTNPLQRRQVEEATPKGGQDQRRAEEACSSPDRSASYSASPPRSQSMVAATPGVAKYVERGELLLHGHRRRQPGQRQVYVPLTQEDRRMACGTHLPACFCTLS